MRVCHLADAWPCASVLDYLWYSLARPSERAVGVGGGPAYRLTMSLDMDTRPSTRGAKVKGGRKATALSPEVIDKQIALELSARKMLTITP